MLIDMHNHTRPKSHDSVMSAVEFVTKAQERGLDGVCFTEHDVFWDDPDAEAVAREHNFLVVRGCEISTDAGHVLVYGLPRRMANMFRAKELRKIVDDHGALMVLAHPFRNSYYWGSQNQSRDSLEKFAEKQHELFQLVDALEAYNGCRSKFENDFCLEICERHGFGATGGSDAHSRTEVGVCATRIEAPVQGLEDLVREVRAKRSVPVYLPSAAPAESATT